RLAPREKYQMSTGTADSQALFSFEVLPASDSAEPSVSSVTNDLNILIKNKWITAVSQNNYSLMLDETYGFRETELPWETYKLQLIAAGAILAILILIFVQVQIKYYDVAKLEILNAPFSLKAEYLIFWSTISILFIEDIPQLTIQILYLTLAIEYDIVSLLTLASCIITILQTMLMALYRTIRSRKQICIIEKLGEDEKSLDTRSHPSDESTQTASNSKLGKTSINKFGHAMMTVECESDTYVPEHMSQSDGTTSRLLRRGGSCNDFLYHPCEVQGMIIQPRPKSWDDIVRNNGEFEDDETVVIKENESIKKVSVIENNEGAHNEQTGIVITVGSYGDAVIPEISENENPKLDT
ncbi:9198_t:CDS:2, partial [Acaulospora colombiana]